MEVRSDNFVALADIAIHDEDMRSAVGTGTRNAFHNRQNTMYKDGAEHGNALRQQAAEAKRRALRKLPELLELAEKNLTANGFTVLWAVDGDEANQHVLDIARKHRARSITKSKSMLTEETGLNHVLEHAGLEVVETDLGEYILQLDDETPSHIIAPVIHKTKESIKQVFVEKLNMEPTDDAGTMVQFAREKLREAFIHADIGVSGGNFIIAEAGSLGLVMNEGNGRMCTSLPKIHVAMVGIEKVVETLDDYATLTQVLPRSGTGQKLTVYTNIINGPKRPDEEDGPEHVYIILVDNGRSNAYGTKYSEALACIRCGACLNACPVYRATGGHAYGWVYAGPIGAVLTPLYVGLDKAKPLPQASSLCGSCKQVCPVDIDIPRMLLDLRAETVDEGLSEKRWDWTMKGYQMAFQSPGRFNMAGKAARIGQASGLDNVIPSPLKQWAEYRDYPEVAPKSFHQLWSERQKGKAD